jgi:hypothetical protein
LTDKNLLTPIPTKNAKPQKPTPLPRFDGIGFLQTPTKTQTQKTHVLPALSATCTVPDWTLDASLDASLDYCISLDLEPYTSIPPHLHSKSHPIFLLFFGGVAPPDFLYKRRACSPKAESEEREVGNSAEPYSEQSSRPRRRATQYS